MKTNNHLFLDIHAIQTLPPSNINRDDTGSPKTAQYGGVRRARVSSQSWKKAIREYVCANWQDDNIGCRTLRIVRYVADEIMKLAPEKTDAEALKMANTVFINAGIKTKGDQKKKNEEMQAQALFFLGHAQAVQLAKAAIDGVSDKKALQEILHKQPAVDIALFGRMVALDKKDITAVSLNEDASVQVAHAISTHAIQNEFDFYTAIDDLAPEDNAGAGMMGTIEFNSSTLYRYANVAVHELYKQLEGKEATINALKLFVEAFSNSLPTGKVNTFANQTLPQAIVVTVREDRPVNMVSAFEKPITSSEGYVVTSIKNLDKEYTKAEKFVEKPLLSMYVTTEDIQVSALGNEKDSLSIMLNELTNTLSELLEH